MKFYIGLKTDEIRDQYLEYDSHIDAGRFVHDSDDDVDYFQIPLPVKSKDGDWHTLIIDLQKSANRSFGRKYEYLKFFKFRWHVGIADLLVSDNREAMKAVAINPIFVE